jgi:hypothetical protein
MSNTYILQWTCKAFKNVWIDNENHEYVDKESAENALKLILSKKQFTYVEHRIYEKSN